MTSLFFKTFRRQAGFKPLLAFFICLALLGPKKADAAANQHGIGLGLGQVLLMGDFAKNFTDSMGFDLMYTYEASNLFGLLVSLHKSSHESPGSTTSTTPNSLSIMGLTPNLRINLAYIDKLIIYSFVGFGLMKIDETIGSTQGSVTTLGFDMGAALNLALDQHFQFGLRLGFNNVFGKTDPATVTTSNPTGLSIGGTYLDICLQVFYIF